MPQPSPVSTKDRLLDAAERLFAERGVHATSSRDIVSEAGQRNESALQYHFGSREGLIEALHERRLGQVQAARFEKLEALLATDPTPSVRDLILAITLPVIELCGRDAGFIAYLRVFGQVAMAPSDALAHGLRHEAASVREAARLIMTQLDLHPRIERLRFDAISRFVILSLSQHARNDGSFRGRAFELYFNDLVDVVCGMLRADVSEETRRALARQGAQP
ncbi:MAG: helix-turn-helix domain-containing protein [Pseudomonadales bacterium]